MSIQKQKPVTLSITSGKGGVGKTNLAVNLAFALMNKGQRVLLVDGDLGLANVDVLLGLSVKNTIRNILESGTDPLESVIYIESNLGILPASSGVPEMVTLGHDEQNKLGELLTSLSNHFNYILMDTAAGIGPSVLWFNNFADHNIVVLKPDPTSLTDAYALIKTLSGKFGRDIFYLVLNFVKEEKEDLKTYETLKSVASKFLNLDLQYLGPIPEDKAVTAAICQQMPFIQKVPQCKASQAVFKLADRIQMIKKTRGSGNS